MVLRRYRSSVELLPHDVVELILECIPVEALLRFRSVSKKWKSTIDSRRFKERHLIRRRQLRAPDVIFMHVNCDERLYQDDEDRAFALGSSKAWTIRFPNIGSMCCYGSCDGLVCLYCLDTPSVVVNPATGFEKTFPLSNFQHLLILRLDREGHTFPCAMLGFGRDLVSGTYKAVWLYNSSDFVGLDNTTTCEIFDFTTDSWRFLVPASPHRINPYHKPVYLDGSLYWFTDCEQPEVLSFDLHTETFQVICKAPFAHPCDPRHLTMGILDNRLCVSERKGLTQVIWSLDSSVKTWNTLCSLDLTNPAFSWLGKSIFALFLVAILDKGQLMLKGRNGIDPVVIHDLHTKSYDLLFQPNRPVAAVYFFESLFSALSD